MWQTITQQKTIVTLIFFILFGQRPGKQFFSYVGTEPPLPVLLGGKYVLLKDTIRRLVLFPFWYKCQLKHIFSAGLI